MIEFDKHSSILYEIFTKNSKSEMLSTELKQLLGYDDNGRNWGSLMSKFIKEGYLIKVNGKEEKENSKPVYYYQLGANSKPANNKNTLLVMDQFGKIHPSPTEENLDEYLINLLKANPILEITVYKSIKTAKASISIDIK